MELEYHVIWLIFALGMGFLSCELFVPGGMIGVIGFVMVAAGVASAIYNGHHWTAGIMGVITVVGIPLGVVYALKKFSLKEELSGTKGFTEGKENQDLLGKVGRAITTLRPSGTAEFDGQRFSVMCETGMVDADERITIIRVEGNRIFVRAVEG